MWRARACVRVYAHTCLSFFRNRRRVGGAKLEETRAVEGRRPVINGTRETAFLESLLVLLFAATSSAGTKRERAERSRSESHPSSAAARGRAVRTGRRSALSKLGRSRGEGNGDPRKERREREFGRN